MMLIRKKSLLSVLCLLAVISLICAFPRIATAEQVTGTIYALEWDDNGNATAAEIVTDEGDAFIVSNGGRGSQVLELEGKVVTATGTITADENEQKSITISSYTVQE
jgi:hypothetical protein